MESRGDQEIDGSPAARTIAVIVGIEVYQYSKPPYVLQGVKYAGADAKEFASTVKTQFHVDDDDLKLWINEQATGTSFKNELAYLASSLGPNDRFIFYYAGHGFYANGANRLTVWDSHPTSLPTTTVCLREVLLSQLQKSKCSQALLFIDACAVPLEENFQGRDVLSELDQREFEEFVQSRNYQALFMSCSPGEKSFPSKELGHGIWTWFLLQALNGRAPSALYKEEWLTDASLRDYLRNEVEKYVRERAKISSRQKPYSLINAENTFEILRFSKEDLPIDHLSAAKLVPEKAFPRQQEARGFSQVTSVSTRSCDPEELRALADDVRDVVEARFPSNQYEDFLEEQHGKGRLIFKLDPSIQPGRIEVEISCNRMLRSLNIKLMRSNKPVVAREFSVSNTEAGQPSKILIRDLGEWLKLL